MKRLRHHPSGTRARKVECTSGEYTARIGGQIHELPLGEELILLIR